MGLTIKIKCSSNFHCCRRGEGFRERSSGWNFTKNETWLDKNVIVATVRNLVWRVHVPVAYSVVIFYHLGGEERERASLHYLIAWQWLCDLCSSGEHYTNLHSDTDTQTHTHTHTHTHTIGYRQIGSYTHQEREESWRDRERLGLGEWPCYAGGRQAHGEVLMCVFRREVHHGGGKCWGMTWERSGTVGFPLGGWPRGQRRTPSAHSLSVSVCDTSTVIFSTHSHTLSGTFPP